MLPSVSSRHRKTAVLTLPGFQKLETAKATIPFSNDRSRSWTLESLSEITGLSTHTLSKIHARRVGVDVRSLIRYFSAFHMPLEPSDYVEAPRSHPPHADASQLIAPSGLFPGDALPLLPTVSWGMAPDVSVFYGRITELETLRQWILEDSCRLVMLLGMVGIGKTWLATKLAEQIQSKFQVVIWRNLQPIAPNYPPLPFNDFLDDLIHHLALQPIPVKSESWGVKMRQIMTSLSCTPCLLVLDNIEAVLQPLSVTDTTIDASPDSSVAEAAAYCYLFKNLGQGRHQSCVILTSRVEPKPFQLMSGNSLSIRLLALQGLSTSEIQQMFRDRGSFQGLTAEWEQLVTYYGGNPLFLGIASRLIQQLFNGNLNEFLGQSSLMLNPVRELLDQQFDHLSDLEQTLIKVLVNQTGSMHISELRSQIAPSIPHLTFLETLKSLEARSLVQKTPLAAFLRPFIRDYGQTRFGLSG